MDYKFPRILVPVDGSPQSLVAFKAAIDIAKKFESHLTTLHIDEKGVNEEGLRESLESHSHGFDYHYVHKSGTVHKEILRAAKETHAELIIMGSHGVSGFQEFWLGSNSYKVATSATCPVLSMRENSLVTEFKTIVLPIDTSFETRQKVPAAMNIARKSGSIVHVLGVSSDNGKEAEYKVDSFTRQVITSLKDKGIKTVLEKKLGGNITNITIEYAQSVNADLVIIMTEQELQLGSFFFGKFAQQMVNHSPVPVLSVPPREELMGAVAKL